MTATASIDAIEWLRQQVEAAVDGLRTMLTEMVNLLRSSELDAICGAGYGPGPPGPKPTSSCGRGMQAGGLLRFFGSCGPRPRPGTLPGPVRELIPSRLALRSNVSRKRLDRSAQSIAVTVATPRLQRLDRVRDELGGRGAGREVPLVAAGPVPYEHSVLSLARD